jgi:hypothetical protein
MRERHRDLETQSEKTGEMHSSHHHGIEIQWRWQLVLRFLQESIQAARDGLIAYGLLFCASSTSAIRYGAEEDGEEGARDKRAHKRASATHIHAEAHLSLCVYHCHSPTRSQQVRWRWRWRQQQQWHHPPPHPSVPVAPLFSARFLLASTLLRIRPQSSVPSFWDPELRIWESQ